MGACLGKPSKPAPKARANGAQHKAAAPAQPKKPVNQAVGKQHSKLRTDVKVRDVYKLGKTLGTGGFAVVKLATDRATGEEYACKIMALPPLGAPSTNRNENTREDVFAEIDILVDLDHENVLYMKEYFEESNKVYLITELLTGGELLDAVLERGSYSESDARLCFVQLLQGIRYLHTQGVVHRDLKLENLLLVTATDLTRIKIADFGLASKLINESAMDTICGTPQYVAPEVIQGGQGVLYGPQVDLWSAGVTLYILLGGYPPFYDESEPALFQLIRKGRYKFDDPVWDTVSDSAKDLVAQLLTVDPAKRPAAAEALRHPWITAFVPPDHSLHRTRENMARHLPRQRFKNVVHTIIAEQRLQKALKQVQSGETAKGEYLQTHPDDIKWATEAAKRQELHVNSLRQEVDHESHIAETSR